MHDGSLQDYLIQMFVESTSREKKTAVEVYSKSVENIDRILIQAYAGNNNIWLFNNEYFNLTDEDGDLLTGFP